jgi:hypothetical protein
MRRLALVRVELLLDGSLRLRRAAQGIVRVELHFAHIALADDGNVVGAPDDLQFPLDHGFKFTRSERGFFSSCLS